MKFEQAFAKYRQAESRNSRKKHMAEALSAASDEQKQDLLRYAAEHKHHVEIQQLQSRHHIDQIDNDILIELLDHSDTEEAEVAVSTLLKRWPDLEVPLEDQGLRDVILRYGHYPYIEEHITDDITNRELYRAAEGGYFNDVVLDELLSQQNANSFLILFFSRGGAIISFLSFWTRKPYKTLKCFKAQACKTKYRHYKNLRGRNEG